MKLKVVLLAVFGALLLTACAGTPVLRDPDVLKDTSLISGEPCSAPCFQGITPGVTAWNEALTLVEDSALFTNLQTQESADTVSRSVEFDAKEGNKRCCGIYSDDGKIVSSVFTLVAPEMQLGEVIEKYGDPTYLTAEKVSDDQASVALVYPDVPMILYVFAAGLETGTLSETSEIFGVVYLTTDNMQTALGGSSLYGWQGYGAVAELTLGDFVVTPEATAEATEQSGN